jgi:hypothetical protein
MVKWPYLYWDLSIESSVMTHRLLMKALLGFIGCLASLFAFSQSVELPFNKVTIAELDMKSYLKDTSAIAVILNEIGSAHISDDHELIFEYYLKIKILKRRGFDRGNFTIPLHNRKIKKNGFCCSSHLRIIWNEAG